MSNIPKELGKNTEHSIASADGNEPIISALEPNSPIPYKYKVPSLILLLATIYTLYVAQSLIVPLLFTCLVALLLSPLVTYLQKLYIPRTISSLALLTLFIGPLFFLGVELTEPVQKWAKQIPKLSQQVTQEVENIAKAFEEEAAVVVTSEGEEKRSPSWFSWFDTEPEPIVIANTSGQVVSEKLKESGLQIATELLIAAPVAVTQFFTALMLILFLLIFSPRLYQSYINNLETQTKKDKAVKLVTNIQKQLSNYVLTLSVINVCLGVSTAIVLHFIGMEDALLWGVLVALLNFIPYVGMLIGMSVLALAATVQYGFSIDVLIPLACYAGLNTIESQFITPFIMGSNMLINPLVVVLWLLVCGWMWGIAGVLIAVPILVCLKIACFELDVGRKWISIIETQG